ncbi:E3 ubiquitin-protein ligase MARCH3-like [Scleropages formosus]|uniref:RING-type E3 ubiquitin transferase n=1 Tax=Scleropages formosus TaxID=113540 RepID=A0A0N8K1D9_SCLFO|nr:E3 ubiquitin-protein ligase MARCH3-like [Scleropages formosus]
MATEEATGLGEGGPVALDLVQVKSLLEPVRQERLALRLQEVIDGSNHVPAVVTTSRTNSEDPFCRICHEGSGVEELLSPCDCAGTLATVHRSCVERWLAASNTSRCELCHFEFALERLPKPLSEWLHAPSTQHQRRTLCGDAICFMFITPLASLSGWLCVQGAVDLYYSNSTEALGLIVLTLALFAIYLFWTVVSLRYHIHLFETWRQTNQRVRLQVPRPAGLLCSKQALLLHPSSKDTSKESVV